MVGENTIIWVQVQANARKNEVLGFRDGILRVKIAAPPIKNKANQELIEYLSHILGISKSKLTVEKGMTSKRKAISISGLTQNQVNELLGKLEFIQTTKEKKE